MKIELNLARPAGRLERSAAIWAPVLTVAALALLARIIFTAWVGFVEFRQVRRSVLRYQAEIADIQVKQARAREVLHQAPTLKLYRQIGFLNSLIDQKRLSLSELAVRVIKLLPSQTRLHSLALGELQGEPVVQFSIEGEQDGVYTFLSNLEGSSDFDAPSITSEAIEQQGSEKGLVLLTCSARYVGVRVASTERKLR